MGLFTDEDRVSLKLMDAIRLGYGYIRKRFERAAVIIASVALSISFLSTLMVTDALYRTHALAGGAGLVIESYQYVLVFVALAVSVVGISNAMLIAVYERYNEIGTMKCLGALDRHILMIFLVESVIEGFFGGVVGFAFGFVAGLLSTGFVTGFDIFLKFSLTEHIRLSFLSISLSMLLCVSATMYPAYKAARLNPVEALGREL